jgi:hypothetical protein
VINQINEREQQIDHPTRTPPHTTNKPSIFDSGTTGHYILCDTACFDKHPTSSPLTVTLPNGEQIKSTHEATLPFPNLPKKALEAHVFPELNGHALLSIGTFCDAGCTALFTATAVVIEKDGKIVLTGKRQPPGLWKTEENMKGTMLKDTNPWKANGAYTTQLRRNAIKFMHASVFSPTTATWTQAIDAGNFQTWPGLSSAAVRKLLPKSMATAMGHTDQQRKNVRSTKPLNKPSSKPSASGGDEWITVGQKKQRPKPLPTIGENTPVDPDTDKVTQAWADQSPILEEKNLYAFSSIVEIEQTGKSYSDLTGRFPVRSDRGNLYILVVYLYDDNAILVEPIKNRGDGEQIKAYTNVLERAKAGTKLKMHWMDNEASKAVKFLLETKHGMQYQLVPPHIHRRNAAERAIRTFKDHFIAGLSSVDEHFPMRLWDRLLPQAEITLNLLRNSRTEPTKTAYEAVFGKKFDYNATPMAPPGCKVLVHEKPSQRASWAPHGVTGWYLGPAIEHYRCYRCYVAKPNQNGSQIRLSSSPKTPKEDAAVVTAEALVQAIRNNQDNKITEKAKSALEQISELFECMAKEWDEITTTSPAANLQRPTITDPPPLPRVADGLPPRVADSPPPRVEEAPRQGIITRSQTVQDQTQRHKYSDVPTANAVMHPISGRPMTYRELLKDPLTKRDWELSAANEFGRLAQGVGGRIKGTDTIKFIPHSAMPSDRTATYPRFVCEYRPQKTEVNRTRLTLGGNLIKSPGEVSTKTAELETIKILFNSVISTAGAKFISIDIKNFYLNTPLERPEYVRIPANLIPDEIVHEYKLTTLIKDGNIMAEANKGMYGLPQAGILAAALLEKRLQPHGYYQCTHTPGLWRHRSRPTVFALVVDDFGVKFLDKADALHLLAALKTHYEVTVDWDGKLFCGISLDWDYTKRTVDLCLDMYKKLWPNSSTQLLANRSISHFGTIHRSSE